MPPRSRPRVPEAGRSGAAAASVLLLLPACATIGSWLPGGRERIPSKLDAARVPHALERGRAELEAGDTGRTLDWMRAAAKAENLDPELRDDVQRLLEEAATRRMSELSRPDSDPDELAELVDLELPRQIAVSAGVHAARSMHAQGEDLDAFRLLKRVDTKFPLHHERVAAGELLAEIGFALAADDSRWLLFFTHRGDAQEVLEYLVLEYPRASRCDEAYETLAGMYEEDGNWQLAIERLDRLVLNHPASPLRPAAQARIPRLRLRAITSPEYDRGQVQRARRELEDWLRAYPGHEAASQVSLDLADSLRRLSDNDLIVAAFYRRVSNEPGARWHAGRAVEEARAAGDELRARRAEEFLAGLPAQPGDEAASP